MLKVREVIVVEGRYDKNTLRQAVDCTVIETAGFGIFSDNEKIGLLRRLAQHRGLIILTDSDSAGFLIRNHLKGMLNGVDIKHAYIPDIRGREKRKRTASKEGKLGVEGMRPSVIIQALRRAGATFESGNSDIPLQSKITKADLFSVGLSGAPDSSQKRKALLKKLDLPERLTANGLLDVLNMLYTRDAFFELLK
jgi:ribonuclease M5